MTDQPLGAAFQMNRPRLSAIAFRMLGSRAEAEDAVQDTWLRLSAADPDRIENLDGWLTTVTARVCLDRLKSRPFRSEEPTGDTCTVSDQAGVTAVSGVDPAEEVVIAESVGAALAAVLDSLGPAERVAFVLHDVFAVGFDEIAGILDRSPAATRQLASRARRRIRGGSGSTPVDLVVQRNVVDAFLRAARGGDLEGLIEVLDPSVVFRPDVAAVSAGSHRAALGAEQVASTFAGGAHEARRAVIDGLPGLVWCPGGVVRGVVEFVVVAGRITAIAVTGDVGRIARLDIVVLDP